MINKVGSTITFKKTQPVGGDLRGIKKDLGNNIPPYFPKDLASLTLKYKN